jgi:hypothetical protein
MLQYPFVERMEEYGEMLAWIMTVSSGGINTFNHKN